MIDPQKSQSAISGFIQRRMAGAPQRRSPTSPQAQFLNLSKAVTGYEGEQIPGWGTITTPYLGSTKFEPGGTHLGVDIAAAKNSPLKSFVGGTVTGISTGHKHGESGFGNQVIITTPDGMQHRFSHLENAFVKVGTPVSKGALIGLIGDTGSSYSQYGKNADSSHVDYRVYDPRAASFINPMQFVKTKT